MGGVPWKRGKTLIWNSTCPDTYAPLSRSLVTHAAGEVAKKAEVEKEEKYSNLLHSHDFTPVTVETSGVFGPKTMSFIREVGKRLWIHSGELKATSYLIQRLSV